MQMVGEVFECCCGDRLKVVFARSRRFDCSESLMERRGFDSYFTSDILIYRFDIKNSRSLGYDERGLDLEQIYNSIVICLAQYDICAWKYETPSGKGCEGDDQGRWKQSAMPSRSDQVNDNSSGLKRRIV